MLRALRRVSVAALVALPSLAAAQGGQELTFGASAGLSLPQGSLGTAANAGYVVAGHAFYRPRMFTELSFRGDVSYDAWKTKTGSLDLHGIGFVADAVYALDAGSKSAVRPYVLGGGGFFSNTNSISSNGFKLSKSYTDPGVQVGVGAEFAIAGFSTFAEAKYVNTFGSSGRGDRPWIPITFGVHF